jgi:hypothetical protein
MNAQKPKSGIENCKFKFHKQRKDREKKKNFIAN